MSKKMTQASVKSVERPPNRVMETTSLPPSWLPHGMRPQFGADGKQTGIIEVHTNPTMNLYRAAGGSESAPFNNMVVSNLLPCLPTHAGKENNGQVIAGAVAALEAFKPTDEIEGMLAAQAVAMHHASMECFRRAMLTNQTADTSAKLRRDGTNLARGMTDMLDALDRKRGKGPQVVRVERVVVHEGGQAIVGNVAPSDGKGRGAT